MLGLRVKDGQGVDLLENGLDLAALLWRKSATAHGPRFLRGLVHQTFRPLPSGSVAQPGSTEAVELFALLRELLKPGGRVVNSITYSSGKIR